MALNRVAASPALRRCLVQSRRTDAEFVWPKSARLAFRRATVLEETTRPAAKSAKSTKSTGKIPRLCR